MTQSQADGRRELKTTLCCCSPLPGRRPIEHPAVEHVLTGVLLVERVVHG